MNQISTLSTFVLFGRIALRRTLNRGAMMKFPGLKKKDSGAAEATPRSATVHRGQKKSLLARMFGMWFAAMASFGLFMLLFTTMFVLMNTVLLQEFRTAPVLKISAESYAALQKADKIADKVERDAALTKVFESEYGSTATWLLKESTAIAQGRYEKSGLAAFEVVPASTTWEGALAYLSPAGQAKALRVLGGFMAILNLSFLCLTFGMSAKNLTSNDPALVWLWQFPVSRRVLYTAKLFEYSVDSLLAPVATVFFATALWLCGVSFWSALGLGTVLGISAALSVAAIRVAVEVAMIQLLGRKARGTIVALMSAIGGMALLVTMTCCNSQTVVEILVNGLAALPGAIFWSPLSGGIGAPAMVTMTSMTWVLAAPIMAIASSAMAVMLAVRLTRSGLGGGQDSVRGSHRAIATDSKISRLSAAAWKELLQIRRQPELLGQILAAPLSIAFFAWIGGYQKTMDTVTSSGANMAAAILGAGAYMLTIAATQTLSRELKMLWFLQAQPQPLADIVRSKARVWGLMTLFLTLPLAGWAIYSSPAEAAAILIRLPFVVVIMWLLAELIFGLTALSANVISEQQIRFRRSMLLLPALLMVDAAAAVHMQNWWLQLSVLASLVILNTAVRERQFVELSWLSEPVEAPPKEICAMHGVMAYVGFQTLQNTLLVTLTSTKAFTANGVVTLAYCGSAVVTAAFCWLWLRRNRLSLPSRPERGPVTRPLLVGLAVSCLAGFAVTWVRNFVEAGCQIPAKIGGGINLDGVYDKWYLLVLFVVAAPLFEEWIFRGLMFRSLRRKWSVALSVAVTAILFASLHPVAGCVALVTLGAATALTAEKTGRLWPSITIHAGYNFMIWALCVM